MPQLSSPSVIAIAALLAASLVPAAPHSGVVSSAGQPVPGATVTARQGERRLLTSTDENGRYEFRDLPAGVWLLEVGLFGFQTAFRELNVPSTVSTLEWTLELHPYSQDAPDSPVADPSAAAAEEVSAVLATEPLVQLSQFGARDPLFSMAKPSRFMTA